MPQRQEQRPDPNKTDAPEPPDRGALDEPGEDAVDTSTQTPSIDEGEGERQR